MVMTSGLSRRCHCTFHVRGLETLSRSDSDVREFNVLNVHAWKRHHIQVIAVIKWWNTLRLLVLWSSKFHRTVHTPILQHRMMNREFIVVSCKSTYDNFVRIEQSHLGLSYESWTSISDLLNFKPYCFFDSICDGPIVIRLHSNFGF